MMKTRRPIWFLMLGVGLIIVTVVALAVLHNLQTANSKQARYQWMAHHQEAEGILPATEHMHIFAIRDKVTASHSISDEDLNWVLDKLKTNSAPGKLQALARADLLEPISGLEGASVPSSQKDRIFKAVVPMLSNDPSFDELDKTRASNVMRSINDKRAIPYLVPLLSNSDEQVREHAQHALAVIGYKSR